MNPISRILVGPLAVAFLGLAIAGAAHAQGDYSAAQSLKHLHDALHLTPAQQTAWAVFAAANAPDPQEQAREEAAQKMIPTLRAPQRVDLTIAAARADLASLRKRGQALKTFYAQLTPKQQRTFDRETLAPQEPQQ